MIREADQESEARATGRSRNDGTPQAFVMQRFVGCLKKLAERAGFEPAEEV